MDVLNIHDRLLEADPMRVGELIDSLGAEADRLWPKHAWPPMEFDRPLAVGARGGHGPIRYFVADYVPFRSIRFRFTGPKGFDGFHGYEISGGFGVPVVLRHTLKMNARGPAILTWPLIYRPLHDALMEDSLAFAQESLGLTPRIRTWSPWVRLLRWVVSGGRARAQKMGFTHCRQNAADPDLRR